MFFRFKLNPSTTQRTSVHEERRVRVPDKGRVRVRQRAEVRDRIRAEVRYRVRVIRPWVLCKGRSIYDRASGQIS